MNTDINKAILTKTKKQETYEQFLQIITLEAQKVSKQYIEGNKK